MLKKILLMFAAAVSLMAFTEKAYAQSCEDSSDCGAGTHCVMNSCVEQGPLSIMAFWEKKTDIDLHVVTPSGVEISADIADTRKADGGEIVRDSCYSGNCPEGEVHVEQVLWTPCTNAPNGRFRVWVENYDGLDSAVVRLRAVMPNGELRELGNVWVDAEEGAKSVEYSFEVTTEEPPEDGSCIADSDGDGLCDEWETCGIDVDNDGEADWQIPGADPRKKDLYIELDYQVGNDEFSDGTSAMDVLRAGVSDTVAAFADAPVEGADGVEGIALHVIIDEEFSDIGGDAISETDEVGKEHLNQLMFNADAVDEETTSCEGGYFGTEEDREDDNCEKIIKAKRLVYRYAVSAYARPGTRSSGRASGIPGTAFIVSIGSWGDRSFNSDYYGGTFMHELGHTLNLRHGGHENFNCKVNYLSVMSYLYQLTGRYPGRNLDYSREKLADLDPSDLDETVGIAGSADWGDVIFGHEGALTLSGDDASQPIDFSQDGDTEDTGYSHSVAHFASVCTREDDLTVNESHDDWSALTYAPAMFDGHITGASDQGDAESNHEEEMTLEQAMALEDEIDDDEDDVPGSEDNCLGIPNPDQADRDNDFVGDACDACPDQSARGMGDGCPYSGRAFDRTDNVVASAAGGDGSITSPETEYVSPQSGGCSAAGSRGSSPIAALLLLAGLFVARRRRRS